MQGCPTVCRSLAQMFLVEEGKQERADEQSTHRAQAQRSVVITDSPEPWTLPMSDMSKWPQINISTPFWQPSPMQFHERNIHLASRGDLLSRMSSWNLDQARTPERLHRYESQNSMGYLVNPICLGSGKWIREWVHRGTGEHPKGKIQSLGQRKGIFRQFWDSTCPKAVLPEKAVLRQAPLGLEWQRWKGRELGSSSLPSKRRKGTVRMRCGHSPVLSTRDIDPTTGLAQVRANRMMCRWHHKCWWGEGSQEVIVLMMLTDAWFREVKFDEDSLKITQSTCSFSS